jgi:hypothetical protein
MLRLMPGGLLWLPAPLFGKVVAQLVLVVVARWVNEVEDWEPTEESAAVSLEEAVQAKD